MANKLISQLTGGAANVQDTDVMEAQKNGELITKKFTGLQMRQVEKTERETQDNVIEASTGLNANGSYTAPANSWGLRAADYAAGCTDRGGATGALTENILNGLRLLDARVYDLGNGSVVIAYMGLNSDTTLTGVVPAGYMLEYVIFEELAAQAPILDLGTAAGGNQVFINQALVTSGLTTITIGRTFSLVANTTLYLNDDDAGSGWDGSTVDAYFVLRPVTAGGAPSTIIGQVQVAYYTADCDCTYPTITILNATIGNATDFTAGSTFYVKDIDGGCPEEIYIITTDGTNWYVGNSPFQLAV